MQKGEQNRLVYSDVQNCPLTHYKVPKYILKRGFMQIRGVRKIFQYFIHDRRQKLGGVTL